MIHRMRFFIQNFVLTLMCTNSFLSMNFPDAKGMCVLLSRIAHNQGVIGRSGRSLPYPFVSANEVAEYHYFNGLGRAHHSSPPAWPIPLNIFHQATTSGKNIVVTVIISVRFF